MKISTQASRREARKKAAGCAHADGWILDSGAEDILQEPTDDEVVRDYTTHRDRFEQGEAW
jgi:hypothetical protein